MDGGDTLYCAIVWAMQGGGGGGGGGLTRGFGVIDGVNPPELSISFFTYTSGEPETLNPLLCTFSGGTGTGRLWTCDYKKLEVESFRRTGHL